jgi:hypothetical protein
MEVMMNKKVLVVVGLVVVLLASVAMVAMARGQSELAQVRAATAQFQRVEVAEAAGYEQASPCVEHPELGGMGYNYVNFSLVDLELDPLQPEMLVYAPLPNGKLKLAAVEYAVPIAPWDAQWDDPADIVPPMVLGQHLHRNEHLGLYALHVWIWQNNPAGMFADWNPNVSC